MCNAMSHSSCVPDLLAQEQCCSSDFIGAYCDRNFGAMTGRCQRMCFLSLVTRRKRVWEGGQWRRENRRRNSEGKIPNSIRKKLYHGTGMIICNNIAGHGSFRQDKMYFYRGQSCLLWNQVKQFCYQSGYPGLRTGEEIYLSRKNFNSGNGFLKPALLPGLMRTEPGKSKSVLII